MKDSSITKGKKCEKTSLNVREKSNRADCHAPLTTELETTVLK